MFSKSISLACLALCGSLSAFAQAQKPNDGWKRGAVITFHTDELSANLFDYLGVVPFSHERFEYSGEGERNPRKLFEQSYRAYHVDSARVPASVYPRCEARTGSYLPSLDLSEPLTPGLDGIGPRRRSFFVGVVCEPRGSFSERGWFYADTHPGSMGTHVIQDRDGNTYVAGFSFGYGGGAEAHRFDENLHDFLMSNAGCSDAFLAKFSIDGDLIWTHRVGTARCEEPSRLHFDSIDRIVFVNRVTPDIGLSSETFEPFEEIKIFERDRDEY